MHTIPDIAFAQPQKSYRIWLLICSHTRTALAAKSVTERSCALPISEVESHISDRCSQDLFGGGGGGGCVGAWGGNYNY